MRVTDEHLNDLKDVVGPEFILIFKLLNKYIGVMK